MVELFRFNISILMSGISQKSQRLLNIMLHHQALTAWPLFEITRGMAAEIVLDDSNSIEAIDKTAAQAIFTQMASDVQVLVQKRNHFLHGTWFIGWASPEDQDFSKIQLVKYKTTKDGFASETPPADVSEIQRYTDMCKGVGQLSFAVVVAITLAGGKVAKNFEKDSSGKWRKSN